MFWKITETLPDPRLFWLVGREKSVWKTEGTKTLKKTNLQGCPTGVCCAKYSPKNKCETFMEVCSSSSLDTQQHWDLRLQRLCETCNDDPVREAKAEKTDSGERLLPFRRAELVVCSAQWRRRRRLLDSAQPTAMATQIRLVSAASLLFAASRLWIVAAFIKCEATGWR